MHVSRSKCKQPDDNEIVNQHSTNIFNTDVKHNCEQCEYESTQLSDINEHTNLMHMLLSCDVCEYNCKSLTSLNVRDARLHKCYGIVHKLKKNP